MGVLLTSGTPSRHGTACVTYHHAFSTLLRTITDTALTSPFALGARSLVSDMLERRLAEAIDAASAMYESPTYCSGARTVTSSHAPTVSAEPTASAAADRYRRRR